MWEDKSEFNKRWFKRWLNMTFILTIVCVLPLIFAAITHSVFWAYFLSAVVLVVIKYKQIKKWVNNKFS